MLLDSTGKAAASYGYRPYGDDDSGLSAGDTSKTNPTNPLRYTSKRYDSGSGTLDMGARRFSPKENHFLQEDRYAGALANLDLSLDPLTQNRYALAGGNPANFVEVDGHWSIRKAFKSGVNWLSENKKEIGHGALDVIGLIPVAGEAADLANSAWYAKDGDYANAALSAASAIPVAGWGAAGAKAVKSGLKHSDTVAKVAKKAGGACSFSGETLVLMADGTRKPISQVEVGDSVLTEDPETGEHGPREVTKLWVHQDTVVDLEIDGDVVTTTEDHPFWNATDNEWQQAQQLDRGDKVRTADGTLATVGGLQFRTARTTAAFNLTVDDIHTYYVTVGEHDILVHNIARCGVPGPKPYLTGPHNKKIREVADSITDGEIIGGGQQLPKIPEKVKLTVGGKKGSRRPDISVRKYDGSGEYHINVGKTEKRTGRPVLRERDALDDLRTYGGCTVYFVSYC